MVLSGNAVDHALLMLGCFLAGVPIVPVSAAYPLQSRDFARLRDVAAIAPPGLVYVADGPQFADALAALDVRAETVASSGAEAIAATPSLSCSAPRRRGRRRRVGPDTVAKMLFTSGSTGGPKGVITTHRMLCANQQAIAQA